MKKPLTVCWISAGVSSFIAGWLMRDSIDEFIYIDIDDQHPDSLRFIHDCEKALGKPIQILKSHYGSVENVALAMHYINSPYGAPCTNVLKKRVRKEWEDAHKDYDITYIWGMDSTEKHRAERLVETMTRFNHIFPLIEHNLTKQDCHAMLNRMGIHRPEMYDLGYPNNNCVGCVKGGMGYWNKIRKDFPEVFQRRANLERIIGASCIKGVFLDELDPNRGKIQDEISTECGVMCQIMSGEGES
jgi:3'-phosphoadenosine 5'-phosphosulfate sulfotransferase (PAPS reductase)/FAD synthetase